MRAPDQFRRTAGGRRRFRMSRKIALVACLTLVLAWSMGALSAVAPDQQQIGATGSIGAPPKTGAQEGPIKLARHPDYHAGKIAFSYMGDILTANEDGSGVNRITDNTAREVYPRFSPDGRWIASSSNRYGGYDVFVVPVNGGTPRRLTFSSGGDDVIGWTRDSQKVL